jgi:predicted CoA-binding protein
MPTKYEEFWANSSFAFVANSAKKPFPKLSYTEARKLGKKVFAVDASVQQVEGDPAYPDLDSLSEKPEAVVLEVPKGETEDWVRKVADAGIRNLWIHMGRETPGAVALAKERGLNVLTGTCAVMYVKPGLSYHSIHKWINKAIGRY